MGLTDINVGQQQPPCGAEQTELASATAAIILKMANPAAMTKSPPPPKDPQVNVNSTKPVATHIFLPLAKKQPIIEIEKGAVQKRATASVTPRRTLTWVADG
jgi:hypothetical protein